MSSALLKVEGQADGNTNTVLGPPRQRHPHDPPHKVYAAQRTILLARGARAVTVAIDPVDMSPSFFLGRIIHHDHNRVYGRHPVRGAANETPPQPPARLVEGSSQKDRETREVLDGARPGEPQIRGDGVTVATGDGMLVSVGHGVGVLVPVDEAVGDGV